MPARKWDLIIVGGGAGGLVLALEMARKGFRVAILDQKPGPAALPRGEILQPNGLKVLDQLGLLPALLEADVHLNKEVNFIQLSGEHLCTIDYTRLPKPYPYALILLPECLQKILLEKIEQNANIDMFWDTSFKSLLREGENLRGILGVSQGKEIPFHGPMLVGADGVRSRVRSALKMKHRLHLYADGYITMLLERPEGLKEKSSYYLGKGQIFGAFPVSRTRIYLFYLVRAKALQALQEKGIAAFKEKICALHPEIRAMFSEPLREISSWKQTMYMPCFRVRSETWVANGGALLGDAAHAMNPHVAQGRNTAMEDGIALSNVLESCFEQGDFSRSALSRYERLRRKKIKTLQSMGDEMTLLWNSRITALTWLRDRVFRTVYQQTPLHDKLLRTVAGLEATSFSFADRCKIFYPGGSFAHTRSERV